MRVVVLDLDGVLVDSKDVYARVVGEVLADHGIDVPLADVERARVPHVPAWLGRLGHEPLAAEVRSLVPERAHEVAVREDARGVLEAIAHPLYLVTNSSARFAHLLLDRIGLWGLFRRVVTSDDGIDKTEAIARIARAEGVDPSSVVYVGDTAGDVETARRAGCRSLLLATAWSWDPDVDPSLPDAVVSCFSSLPLALEEMP